METPMESPPLLQRESSFLITHKQGKGNVELWSSLEEMKPPEKKFDAAIAYGQGPIQDKETKIKAEEIAKNLNIDVGEEINSWGRASAIAMGYLGKKGEYKEAYFSGGKTGGVDNESKPFKSEAELMKEGMEQTFGTIDGVEIEVEDESGNTLENYALTLNKMDKKTREEGKRYDSYLMVASRFHVPRIKALSALYNMRSVTVLSSEDVLRVMVHDPTISNEKMEQVADYLIQDRDKKTDPRKAVLDWIDARTDYGEVAIDRNENATQRSYVGGGSNISERKQPFTHYEKEEAKHPGGSEGKNVVSRAQNEDMFTEGLVTLPANWVGYISKIGDPVRFRDALRNITNWNPGFLSEAGISDDTVSRLFNYDLGKPESAQVFQAEVSVLKDRLEPYTRGPKEEGKREYVSLDWKPWEDSTVTVNDTLLELIRTFNKPSNTVTAT